MKVLLIAIPRPIMQSRWAPEHIKMTEKIITITKKQANKSRGRGRDNLDWKIFLVLSLCDCRIWFTDWWPIKVSNFPMLFFRWSWACLKHWMQNYQQFWRWVLSEQQTSPFAMHRYNYNLNNKGIKARFKDRFGLCYNTNTANNHTRKPIGRHFPPYYAPVTRWLANRSIQYSPEEQKWRLFLVKNVSTIQQLKKSISCLEST